MIYYVIQFLNVLEILLFIYFILSWFPLQSAGPIHQIWTVLDRIFGPILAKIRSKIPRTGMIDLSGIILIFSIIILQTILQAYV